MTDWCEAARSLLESGRKTIYLVILFIDVNANRPPQAPRRHHRLVPSFCHLAQSLALRMRAVQAREEGLVVEEVVVMVEEMVVVVEVMGNAIARNSQVVKTFAAKEKTRFFFSLTLSPYVFRFNKRNSCVTFACQEFKDSRLTTEKEVRVEVREMRVRE